MSTAGGRAAGMPIRGSAPLPRSSGPLERDGGQSLYVTMALVCATVAFLGFAPTYWAPMLTGRSTFAPVLHLHAVVFFGWAVLLAVQMWLGATRRFAIHRTLGMFAISVATAMTIFGVLVAIRQMHAAAALGERDAGLAFSIVPLGGIAFFAVVFAIAVLNVRRPEVHKRLMLLASISILDAPLARWFMILLAPAAPAGPPPVSLDLGPAAVALGLLAVPMVADWRRDGRVHRVYVVGAAAYVALKLLQGPLSTTPQWQAFAAALMALGG